MSFFKKFQSDIQGATAIEYAILIVAIAVPVLVSFDFFGTTLAQTLTTASTTMRSGN